MSLLDEERQALEQRARFLDLRVVYRRELAFAPIVMDEHDVIISDDLLWDVDYAKRRYTDKDYTDRTPPEPER